MFLIFKNKKLVLLGITFVFFLFLIGSSIVVNAQSTSVCVNQVTGLNRFEKCRVNSNDVLVIYAEGCEYDSYKVVNETGKDLFIPTRTCAEWNSFLLYHPLGVSLEPAGPNIVFNAINKNSLSSTYETPFIDKLEEWGCSVTVISDGEVAGYNYSDIDFLIIRPPGDTYTAHPTAGLNNLPVNIISHSRHTSRIDLGMASNSGSASFSSWYIADGSHPLSANYNTGDTLSVYTSSAAQQALYSTLTSGTSTVAWRNGGSYYKALAERTSGGYRRIHWAAHRGNILTADGWDLYRNMVGGAADTTPRSLNVVINGPGTVNVNPPNINYSNNFQRDYDYGTSVSLTASTTATGYIFSGWSGACSGTGTCVVEMTDSRSVTANFVIGYSLSVEKTGNGSGTITSSPSGIDCGSTCSAGFAEGTSVTLTASASDGSFFVGWYGECSETGTCVVEMTDNRLVAPIFISFY